MAWHMTGQLIEACSCKAACPCVLGPAEPDQGWCSGALTFVIEQGESDGVNLGGRKVLWLIDLPKDFLSANGTGRIYIDDAAEARQIGELEAIFTGKKGGPGEVLGGLVAKWLPTQAATITIDGGENPSGQRASARRNPGGDCGSRPQRRLSLWRPTDASLGRRWPWQRESIQLEGLTQPKLS